MASMGGWVGARARSAPAGRCGGWGREEEEGRRRKRKRGGREEEERRKRDEGGEERFRTRSPPQANFEAVF